MGEKVLTFLGRGEIWVIGSALVVFLVVTWVLRGAPPGQAAESEEDSDAPRSGYRDRIVAGVVVGLLLILARPWSRSTAASSGRCRSSPWDSAWC